MLSAYTGRGILTINEARAMLGRDPLADPAADRPMALTGTGYVALAGVATTGAAKFAKTGVWDEDQHPLQPAGSNDHQGGRFAPGAEGSGSPGRSANMAGCGEEWNWAITKCDELLNLHEFHPDRSLLGGHTTIGGCAKGFVSQRCGGNRVV